MRRNRRRVAAAVGLAFLVWISQTAYWTINNSAGVPVAWNPGSFPILIQVWEGFTSEHPKVVDGSQVRRAIAEALQRWCRVSAVTAVMGPDTSVGDAVPDGLNIVTIADTVNNRNKVGSAPAVSGSLFVGSTITETDIVFNPDDTFSTIESDSFGVLSLLNVALHELGHSLNLHHTVGRRSLMSGEVGSFFDFGFSRVSCDDVAGINLTYSLVGLDQITGAVRGRVTRGGQPVPGAFVVAVDQFGVLAASAITLGDGTYRLRFLPPGNYTLYVEPLDGPFTNPPSVATGNLTAGQVVTDFLPRFYQDSMAPNVSVAAAGELTGIDFQVQQGNSAVDPRFLGTSPNVNAFQVKSSFAEAFQGQNTNIIVAGKGVETLLDNQGTFFLGGQLVTGAVTRSGSLTNGDPFKAYALPVPLDTVRGERSVFVQKNPETGVITGGLEVFSPFRYQQAFAQFVQTADASSGLFLINTDLQRTATGKISPRSSGGSVSSIGLGSLVRDASNRFDFSINPGGTLSVTSSGPNEFIGSLRAEADRSVGGTVLFQTAFGTTGVGASEELYTFASVVIKSPSQGRDTGFALTNLEDRPVQIHI